MKAQDLRKILSRAKGPINVRTKNGGVRDFVVQGATICDGRLCGLAIYGDGKSAKVRFELHGIEGVWSSHE